ncbi:MAG: hypothetical protein M3Y27_24935 [Acidobacteriota bacterium]|nr:hypothetical protein [Acidobacteriota bacterium]
MLLVGTARAELQLSPRPFTYEIDGAKFSQVAFTDGDKEVTYVPPRGWECSGSGSQLRLRPKDKSEAEATVTRTALPQPMVFDEETIKSLTQQVMAALPSGSSNVQLVGQDLNPVLIDKKETLLVTMSYTLYGDTYGRSVMFMNRGKEQIRFQLVSRLADFKDLQSAFQQSHFSWKNL